MNILVLCTGNSARSILAEALINEIVTGARAYSAGSSPAGRVHPQAIRTLRANGFPTQNLRSKSWDEFVGTDADPIDLVITVCDNAANEPCPVWPGQPHQVHWGVADPAVTPDESQEAAFQQTFLQLKSRVIGLAQVIGEGYRGRKLVEALSMIHRQSQA